MIGIVAKFTVQADKREEFEQVAKDLMAKVKANEPGCLTYQLYKSKKEADTYIMMEQYASQADVQAHGKTAYFAEVAPRLGACLTGAPDVQYYDSVE